MRASDLTQRITNAFASAGSLSTKGMANSMDDEVITRDRVYKASVSTSVDDLLKSLVFPPDDNKKER
jgi:hypothetical protein